MSHPMWVRGLKPNYKELQQPGANVASYVGAWIETTAKTQQEKDNLVASYVGAWIET